MQPAVNDASYVNPPATHHVFPSSVREDGADGERLYEGDHPLVWALENIGSGDARVCIHPGLYLPMKVERSGGGLFFAKSPGAARVVAGGQDTIAFTDHQAIQNPLTLKGLAIDVSARAGIINQNLDTNPLELNLEFCTIDGHYDHGAPAAGQPESKWGMQVYRWKGYAAYCTFQNIKREHGLYDHRTIGERLLLECEFRNTGRTNYQHVARTEETGFADEVIKVTNCSFADGGLKDGGGNLTAQGMNGLVVKGGRSDIGMDADLVSRWKALHPGKVFGAGHFVNWAEWQNGVSRNDPSELIAFHDFDTWTAPGCGNADAMQVLNARQLQLSGDMEWAASKHGVSLRLDQMTRIVLGDSLLLNLDGDLTNV